MNNREIKPVSFNNVREREMLDFLEDKKFATYVKGLIQKDMNNKNNPIPDISVESLLKVIASGMISNASLNTDQLEKVSEEEKLSEEIKGKMLGVKRKKRSME